MRNLYYHCCDDNRRNAVKDHPLLNGIEFLEVVDNPGDAFEDRQTTLIVHFIKDLIPGVISKENIKIEGGERVKNIEVVNVAIGFAESPPQSPPANADRILVVKVKEAGDFSRYRLRLIKNKKDDDPPEGFDPVLSLIEFSFKVLCENEFDCKPACDCPEEAKVQPEINYLAKDYGSFRQLMLDRMAVLMPQWQERNPADMGIMLVELLAYAGDYLSYQQDAIATEAYLGTARKRISVRRHARLVDYLMHDGCNARTWIHINVTEGINGVVLKKEANGKIATQLLTKTDPSLPKAFKFNSPEYDKAIEAGAKCFELLHDEELYYTHNEMKFYTWGDRECCLPKGATSATLAGDFSTLRAGQFLIFKEVKGPQTGEPSDADPEHRHAVRLTKIKLTNDPLFSIAESPPASPPIQGIPVTRIEWHVEDALPFPLCISSKEGTLTHEDVSVALGNNILADHGRTIEDQKESSLEPDTVAQPVLSAVQSGSGHCCEDNETPVPPRYKPLLRKRPITHAAAFDYNNFTFSASDAMKWSMRETFPAVVLIEKGSSEKWFPQKDLLNSKASKKEFVLEIESDGIGHIRFGDDKQGMRPASGTTFLARYRIGNGTAGNIGREYIAHIVSDSSDITGGTTKILSVTNPFPATGGAEPETIELVKQKAPFAFRTKERAVTSQDYEEMSLRCSPLIQRSACTFRWTGSWRTAFLTIDRFGGEEVTAEFENDIRSGIEKYRMAGHDVEVNGPEYVSLELEMIICVRPNYFASDVKSSLLKIFSNRILPNGRRGVFHPDNFSFGQAVYLSPLYAAAQSVDGVSSVQITKLKRQDDPNNEAINTGKLLLSKLEIARLDNDRNFPDHGVLDLIMKGGK
jgi:hypothetical protein